MDTLKRTIHNLISGFLLPFHCVRLLLQTRALLTRAAIPLALAFGVTALLGGVIQTSIQGGLLSLIAWTGLSTTGWLSWVSGGIALLSAVFFGVFAFTGIASFIATPFNDWLAEATERHTVPPLPPAPTLSIPQAIRNLLLDFFKGMISVIALACTFLLSFVPVLQLAAPILAAYALTFQYLTYPQTRRSEGIRAGLQFMRRNSALCLGFGFSHLLLFSIPIVSAFALPVAVVGGTLLYSRGCDQRAPVATGK